MQYLATEGLDLNGHLIQFDIFEVDTDVYFAHYKDPDGEFQEFYFAKVGEYWDKNGPYTYTYILQTVVEGLGFRFDNRYPASKERETNYWGSSSK